MQFGEIGKIQLEDLHQDILGKAMRGLGIGKNEMVKRVKCEKAQIEFILLDFVPCNVREIHVCNLD